MRAGPAEDLGEAGQVEDAIGGEPADEHPGDGQREEDGEDAERQERRDGGRGDPARSVPDHR